MTNLIHFFLSFVILLQKVTTVKYFLFCLCVFFISCTKGVDFFSSVEETDPKIVITHRNPFSVVDNVKKSRKKRKRKKSYRPPPSEKLIVLAGNVQFVPQSSVSDTIDDIKLSPPNPVDDVVPIHLKDSENPPVLVQPTQEVPLVSVVSSASPLLQKEKVSVVQSDFAKKEAVQFSPPMVQDEKRQPSSSPALQLAVEVDKPDEIFILRPLDILFIIDTSASMNQHLNVFKTKFAGFLNYFFDLHWKVALTNSNHGENRIFLYNIGALKGSAMKLERAGVVLNIRYLSPDIANYNQIFIDSISRNSYTREGDGGLENVDLCSLPPYCDGDQEQPLKVLKSALVKNQDFFRKEADLAVVIISNSRERGGDPSLATQSEEIVEQFRITHGSRKRFEVYSLIIPDGDMDCLNQNIDRQFFFPEGAFSKEIAVLSEMTGGKVFSICLPDYRVLAQSIFNSFATPNME